MYQSVFMSSNPKALDGKLMKIQDSMCMQMNDIKIGDAYGDINKEINMEA